MRNNIVRAVYRSTVATETNPAFQYDVGLKLVFDGIDLPDTYQVHFGNDQRGDAYVCIGNSEGVQIPDALLRTGLPVYAWVWLQTGQDDGETVYTAIIPVIKRAKPVETQPTLVQRDTISEAIAALNAGVETVERIAGEMPAEIDAALAEAKASGEFDGPKGDPGKDGEDGFSPTALVVQSQDGAEISVTDKTGTTTAEIKNGKDGLPGERRFARNGWLFPRCERKRDRRRAPGGGDRRPGD